MFGEDARKASSILDVVLTSRDAGKSGRIPMCGIPYHSAQGYISKLIKSGLKVAVCEQVEDPALAKGLVRREVIRVITSGTYIDEANFEARCLLALPLKINDSAWPLLIPRAAYSPTNEYDNPQRLIEVISKMPAYECVYPQAEEDKIKSIFRHPLYSLKTSP